MVFLPAYNGSGASSLSQLSNFDSLPGNLEVLSAMRENRFTDRQTTSLQLKFAMYNQMLGLFSVVSLTIKMSMGGGLILVSWKERISVIDHL